MQNVNFKLHYWITSSIINETLSLWLHTLHQFNVYVIRKSDLFFFSLKQLDSVLMLAPSILPSCITIIVTLGERPCSSRLPRNPEQMYDKIEMYVWDNTFHSVAPSISNHSSTAELLFAFCTLCMKALQLPVATKEMQNLLEENK